MSLDLPRPYSSSQDDGKLVNGYRPLLVTQDCKANQSKPIIGKCER